MLSKKNFLTILCLGIILFFSSDLWMKRYFKLSFEYTSNVPISFEISYNSSSQKESIKIQQPSGNNAVSLKLYAKKVEDILINIQKNFKDLSISNIKLKGFKTIPLEVDKFDYNNIDSFDVKNNILILSSNQKTPFISYKEKLNAKASS